MFSFKKEYENNKIKILNIYIFQPKTLKSYFNLISQYCTFKWNLPLKQQKSILTNLFCRI